MGIIKRPLTDEEIGIQRGKSVNIKTMNILNKILGLFSKKDAVAKPSVVANLKSDDIDFEFSLKPIVTPTPAVKSPASKKPTVKSAKPKTATAKPAVKSSKPKKGNAKK